MSAFTRFKRSKDNKNLDGSYSVEGKVNTPTAKPITLVDQVVDAKTKKLVSDKLKREKEAIENRDKVISRFSKRLKLGSELVNSIEKVKVKNYPAKLTKLGYKTGLFELEIEGLSVPLYYHLRSSHYRRGIAHHPGYMSDDYGFYIIGDKGTLLSVNRLANLNGYATSREVQEKIQKDEAIRLADMRDSKEAKYIKERLSISVELIESISRVAAKDAPAQLNMTKPNEAYYGEPLLYKVEVEGLKGPIYFHVYSRVWLRGGGFTGRNSRGPGYRESVRLYKVSGNGKLKQVSGLPDLDDYLFPDPQGN